MGRKPKTATETPEQFELPHMPKPEIKNPTALESAIQKRRRDVNTGLFPDVEYIFTEDGLVDWRKMLKPEHLMVNKDRFGADVDIKSLNVTELPDDKVLILLSGFKFLARLRGYSSIEYSIGNAGADFCSTACRICWIPNFESEMKEIVTSAVGDAHYHNTNDFAKFYCGPMSENRSFVRSVKSGLNINILGFDEIGETPTKEDENNESDGPKPQDHLKKICGKNKIEFTKMRERYCQTTPINAEVAMTWEDFKDVPALVCWEIIQKIQAKDKK